MYESAPHYCIMIPLMMLYLNRKYLLVMLFFFIPSELVGKG